MLSKSESLAAVIGALRAITRNESLPQPNSEPRARLNACIGQVSENHDEADMAELGRVALVLLLEVSMSDLAAHRACLEAQRDAAPPSDAPLH